MYLETLKKYFGYDSFRGIQEDIVKSIHEGHDTLGLMPTGGGKSITFQVPALMMDGVCIVITPLIALMKDQVAHLKERGIKAEAIYSGLTHQEIQRILDNAIYGAVKFLYVSPERLHTKLFLAKLYYMRICFITVDEAHCISQWGYDFRPSYLMISKIRELKPEVPVLALTATATPSVIDDIQEKLCFGKYETPRTSNLTPQTSNLPLQLAGSHNAQRLKEPQTSHLYRMSFKRENISYVVRKTEDKKHELIHILSSVQGSAIVYVHNRRKTKELSELINKAGIKATFYHAGLDIAIKDTRQEEWQKDMVRVMVATNAFGMGIDKPDVRLVIHMDAPNSLEEYFQEAGRAGRDGLRSYAVFLYNKSDHAILLNRIPNAFPSKADLREMYDHLAYFFQLAQDSGQGARYEFNMELFCQRFHHFPTVVTGALSILKNAGYIDYEPEPYSEARVMFSVPREELYHINGLTPQEDELITWLLRYYGSLFSELTYIDETYLTHKLGIDEHHLHFILKSLAQRHILRYVPKRNVPVITYLQQRIDSSRLRFPHEIYEDQQKRMTDRINAVINYLDNTERCRVSLLLEYFGEKPTEDCHHCDICLDEKHRLPSHDNKEKITLLLADGKDHLVTELSSLGIPTSELTSLLEELRNDERILIKDNFIILKE